MLKSFSYADLFSRPLYWSIYWWIMWFDFYVFFNILQQPEVTTGYISQQWLELEVVLAVREVSGKSRRIFFWDQTVATLIMWEISLLFVDEICGPIWHCHAGRPWSLTSLWCVNDRILIRLVKTKFGSQNLATKFGNHLCMATKIGRQC